MTPKQAWEILERVTAMLNLTRQDHNTVLKALDVLKPNDSQTQGE